MKKIPLKHKYRPDRDKIHFRRPFDWTKTDVKRKYSMWPPEEREICWACDRFIAHIRDNPPHVTGWLSRGIDKARMLKIKRDIERREGERQKQYFDIRNMV